MTVLLIVVVIVASIAAYLGVALAVLPRVYRHMLEWKPNPSYSYREPGSLARQWACNIAFLWPAGLFVFLAMRTMRRTDQRLEMVKAERAELDRFRAEALRELEEDQR